ncbi:MAG: DUF1552 domain-containing protein [Archangium sp.]|nr:DUF1552 domain-containing protein [Archangium sp.]
MASRFDRRRLLQAAVGVPLLRTLLPSTVLADPAAPPKRLVFWFQPGGVCHPDYHVRPGSTETSWGYDATGDRHTLLPLVPFHDRTVHFDSDERVADAGKPDTEWTKLTDAAKRPFGLTDFAGTVGPDSDRLPDANGHPTRELTIGHQGPVSLLTGRFPEKLPLALRIGEAVWDPKGESIDVAIGRRLPGGSVQLGVSARGPQYNLSFQNDGDRLPIIDDPRQSFERLFTGIPRTPGVDPVRAQLAKTMNRRAAVFEAAYGRFDAIKSGLATPDRERLAQHFDAYKSIFDRLTQLPPAPTASCHSPDAPPSVLNLNDPLQLPVRGKLMIDQMVLALACNVSRVINFSFTFAATNQVFSFLPGFTAPAGPQGQISPDGHHPLSHDAYDAGFVVTAASRPSYEKKRLIERWYAQQLAYFLSQLDAIREADGSTLLDNTVVVVINELSHSGSHNNSNMPIRLYGNARGAFRTGRWLSLPQTPLNNLWVSLANAMGVPMTTFGEPSFEYQYIGESTRWQWSTIRRLTVGPLAQL